MRLNVVTILFVAVAAALLFSLSNGCTQAPTETEKRPPQLPIYIVYVNHVEVESVLPRTAFPLVNGATYTTSSERYAYTRAQLEWEVTNVEAVGGRISFHMSGAFAERALAAGEGPWWQELIERGHTVGVHAHSFLRGPNQFEWVYKLDAGPEEVTGHWRDNHDLVAGLVGAEHLWVGESHYHCPGCWGALSYRLVTTEAMASLPVGQHIVWRVDRSPLGVITYPHFPQIGEAGWHGPAERRSFFDLRLPQLKKEFLMLYLEWLERERLGAAPQVWAFGWANHGGSNTELYAAEIEGMLAWLETNFLECASRRGNIIARFASDHELFDIYEGYERAGGEPLPWHATTVTDVFPYMAEALADAGVVADLTDELGLEGVRLIELERDPPAAPHQPRTRLYLLFREDDGSSEVHLRGVLAARGVAATTLRLLDVVDGTSRDVAPDDLLLGATPLVLEVP